MLTNPIRGKAGRQIIVPLTNVADTIVYTVPIGKYFEMPVIPTGMNITFGGVTIAMSTISATLIAAPLVLQAGCIISVNGSLAGLIGTEYDA